MPKLPPAISLGLAAGAVALLSLTATGLMPPSWRATIMQVWEPREAPTPAPFLASVPRISAEEARKLKDAVYVDVRGPAEYAGGHVAKAISIPSIFVEKMLKSLPKGHPLILYCA